MLNILNLISAFKNSIHATKTGLTWAYFYHSISFKSIEGLRICNCFTVFLTCQKQTSSQKWCSSQKEPQLSHLGKAQLSWELQKEEPDTEVFSVRLLFQQQILIPGCLWHPQPPSDTVNSCQWKIPSRAFWVTDSEIFVGFKL